MKWAKRNSTKKWTKASRANLTCWTRPKRCWREEKIWKNPTKARTERVANQKILTFLLYVSRASTRSDENYTKEFFGNALTWIWSLKFQEIKIHQFTSTISHQRHHTAAIEQFSILRQPFSSGREKRVFQLLFFTVWLKRMDGIEFEARERMHLDELKLWASTDDQYSIRRNIIEKKKTWFWKPHVPIISIARISFSKEFTVWFDCWFFRLRCKQRTRNLPCKIKKKGDFTETGARRSTRCCIELWKSLDYLLWRKKNIAFQHSRLSCSLQHFCLYGPSDNDRSYRRYREGPAWNWNKNSFIGRTPTWSDRERERNAINNIQTHSSQWMFVQ